MKKNISMKYIIYLFVILLFLSCDSDLNNTSSNIQKNDTEVNDKTSNIDLYRGISAKFENGDINVVVEIPTGTVTKWEVEKKHGKLDVEYIDGKPRMVNYLGYPGNYGMIPRTLLPKNLGGDGDPLDVIVLGAPVESGDVVKCRLLGVLKLLDRGEQDDKLIAVRNGTPFYSLTSMEELDDNYKGVSSILSLWFENYKGPGKMKFQEFGNKDEAMNILESSIKAYEISIQ